MGFWGLVKELDWKSVYSWTCYGGSIIGCQNQTAEKVGYGRIACKLREFNIDGLLVIGDFEAFMSVTQLVEQRSDFNAFRIPLICVPASISNNIAGSEFSVGCDTALNEIVSV